MTVHHIRVKFFPLLRHRSNAEFCGLQRDNCKCLHRNLMLGEKVVGFERALGALVGIRLSFLKFNRDSVFILTWHLNCGSPQ